MFDEEHRQFRRNTLKKSLIGCLILIVLAAIIILIACGCWGGKNINDKEVVKVEKQTAGLGVTRDRIISSMAEKGYAFSGEEKSLSNDQPHWAGKTDDCLATLDLFGDKNNLTMVILMFGVPAEYYDKAANGLMYMFIILNDIFPKWEERKEWIISAVDKVFKGEKDEVQIIIDGRRITFAAAKDALVYRLTVE